MRSRKRAGWSWQGLLVSFERKEWWKGIRKERKKREMKEGKGLCSSLKGRDTSVKDA